MSTAAATTSFYEIPVKDKRGNPYDLAALKGKVVLVVNVASKCGFTPQYTGLEELYKKYKDSGLVILGFPCNQFGSQAPGSAEEEESHCQINHGVTFPILEKVECNGDSVSPIYEYLKAQKSGLLGLRRIKWNFEKFLIGKDGVVIDRFASTTTPQTLDGVIAPLL
ncbi:Glutathione peroxidase 2 [Thoreauomyces humboldtii]|nr:Glutathione peroxidase 2 [Thoreauomyces humboldtii]